MVKPRTNPVLLDETPQIKMSTLKELGYLVPGKDTNGGLVWSIEGRVIVEIAIRVYMTDWALTSPYRHKNRDLPKDANSDPWKMELIDEAQEEEGYNERILRLMRRSREILDGLDIPQVEKDIFSWKFYGGQTLKSWPGLEAYSRVCIIYLNVCDRMLAAVSPEKYRIQMFCRTFSQVRRKLLKAA